MTTPAWGVHRWFVELPTHQRIEVTSDDDARRLLVFVEEAHHHIRKREAFERLAAEQSLRVSGLEAEVAQLRAERDLLEAATP